jgi:hypothetical protein
MRENTLQFKWITTIVGGLDVLFNGSDSNKSSPNRSEITNGGIMSDWRLDCGRWVGTIIFKS